MAKAVVARAKATAKAEELLTIISKVPHGDTPSVWIIVYRPSRRSAGAELGEVRLYVITKLTSYAGLS